MLRPDARNLLRVLAEASKLPPVPGATAPSFDAGSLKEILNVSDSVMDDVIGELAVAGLVSVDYPKVLIYGVAVPPGTTLQLSSQPGAMVPQTDAPRCLFRQDNECPAFEGWLDHQVFIVGPANPKLASELEAIKNAIRQLDLEPYLALDDFAKHIGQDAVCAKICRKIIECRFTVVLLTAPEERFKLESGKSVTRRLPRPNVYIEYGMAAGMRRPSIPARRENQRAEFDVVTIDAITYKKSDLVALTEKVVAAGKVLLEKTPSWHTAVSDADRCVAGSTTPRSWLRGDINAARV